jgi:transposase InsO family protein
VKPKFFNYDLVSEKIQELHVKKHFRKAGYQRIYIELKKLGYTIGKNKVRYLMGLLGLLQTKAKKWRRYNSFKGDLGGILPNVINQDFQTTGPYQKAGTDVTMFPLDEQAVFLSPLIDFHTREVLAYAVGTDAKTDKMMTMLTMLKKQHGTSIKGMMIQSDQGSQYQSSHYREILKSYKLIQSMSRRGNCLDNSPTESFFG